MYYVLLHEICRFIQIRRKVRWYFKIEMFIVLSLHYSCMNATHNTKSNNSILEIYARTKLYYDPHLQSTIRLWGAFISYNLKNISK